MKWLVTYVSVSRLTRRRVGKSRTVVFDIQTNDPAVAEQWFEAQERSRKLDCKVVDIRPAISKRKEQEDEKKAKGQKGTVVEPS